MAAGSQPCLQQGREPLCTARAGRERGKSSREAGTSTTKSSPAPRRGSCLRLGTILSRKIIFFPQNVWRVGR